MFSVWNCAPCANFVFEILLKFHQRVPLDVFGLDKMFDEPKGSHFGFSALFAFS